MEPGALDEFRRPDADRHLTSGHGPRRALCPPRDPACYRRPAGQPLHAHPGKPARFAEHSIRRLVAPPDTAAAGTAGVPTAVPAVMSAAMPAEATSLALRRL